MFRSGAIVGAVMLVYAYGLMVTINLTVFPMLQGLPAGFNVLAYVAFALVGLGVSWGAVLLMSVRQDELT